MGGTATISIEYDVPITFDVGDLYCNRKHRCRFAESWWGEDLRPFVTKKPEFHVPDLTDDIHSRNVGHTHTNGVVHPEQQNRSDWSEQEEIALKPLFDFDS